MPSVVFQKMAEGILVGRTRRQIGPATGRMLAVLRSVKLGRGCFFACRSAQAGVSSCASRNWLPVWWWLIGMSWCGAAEGEHRYLYVATPGVRNYLEYGGHGLLVFDIDAGHRFVKRIPTAGLDAAGKPINVKGICAGAATGRLYISTIKQLMCLDLESETILWERTYDAGCDRMSMTPDGTTIFLPSFEGPLWYVVDGADGSIRDKVVPNSGAHNTVVGLSGAPAYLAGLKSPLLTVVDTAALQTRTVGPFSASIRPFTVDGRELGCTST